MTIHAPGLPAAYEMRAPVADDAPALLALVHAHDVATIGHPDFTLEDVRDVLADPRVAPERGAWAVTGRDGAVVGWAHVAEQGVDAEGSVATSADVVVHPTAPEEVGRALLARMVARVAQVADERGVAQARVDAFALTTDAPGARRFAEAGFEVVRRFNRLEVELTGDETAPSPPSRVTVRVADSDANLPLVHEVLFASFADHFGTVPEPYDTWAERMTSSSSVDRTQWWLAEVDGKPAGIVMNSRQWEDENAGWVKNLGVLPAFRGYGLGRLLLRHSLADMARRGRTRAGLGVDTANESGALALYESVGFAPVYAADVWRREVRSARQGGDG